MQCQGWLCLCVCCAHEYIVNNNLIFFQMEKLSQTELLSLKLSTLLPLFLLRLSFLLFPSPSPPPLFLFCFFSGLVAVGVNCCSPVAGLLFFFLE